MKPISRMSGLVLAMSVMMSSVGIRPAEAASLLYSTYLGGTVEDRVNAITLDSSGNVYLTGLTVSGGFPGSAGMYQSANGGGTDAFVTKISAAGAILWSTYLGGAGIDIANAIAVDAAGIVHITGNTTSANFPTATPYQATNGGGTDAFVTAINAAGTALVYSTYLGGAGIDDGYGIAVDTAGNAYVTGDNTSAGTFPTTGGAYMTASGGATDAFVAKFSSAGGIGYSTYLGGTGADLGRAIAIDGVGNAYVTGQAADTFPMVATPFNPTITGALDAFIVKLSSTGASLLYATYVGGSGIDDGFGLALDGADPATLKVYITGYTFSADFPKIGFATVGQTTIGTAPDAYAFKLNMNGGGGSLDGVYSTYLGASGDDRATAITLDTSSNVYVTGRTTSGDFPTVNPIQGTLVGTGMAFVTEISSTGATKVYSSYLGGVTDQEGKGIALDSSANVYVAGWTSSTDFPTASPIQAANAGSFDGFVTKMLVGASAPTAATPAAPKVNSTASLNWEWANGTGATSLSIQASTVGAVSISLSSATTSYTEGGLSPNTAYTRLVRETNGTGSTDSVTMTTTTLASPPATPTFSSASSTTVTVAWVTGAGGAGSYKLERATVAGMASGTSTVAGASSGLLLTTGYTDAAGLQADTVYYYRVLAYNTVGRINPTPSASASVITLSSTAPTSLTGVANSAAQITWSWIDMATNETGYQVQTDTHGLVGVTLPANTTTFVETGLAGNTAYSRHVHSIMPLGEGPQSSTATVYTRPGTPTALKAVSIGDGNVALSWTAPANGAYRYRVDRALTNGGTFAVLTRILGPGTTHQDVLLSPGYYSYQVVAENVQGFEAPAISTQVEIVGGGSAAISPTSTDSVTVVGTDTGTVKTSLVVPPGAFATIVSVAISTTAPASSETSATLANNSARTRGDTQVKLDDDLSDTIRELTAKDASGRSVQPVKGIKLTIPYSKAKVKSYMVASLKICRLNETTGIWEVAEGDNKVDDVAGSVATTITHFSLFRLAYVFAPAATLDAGLVKVFPNPLDLTKGAVRGAVKFDGLTAASVVEVYDLAGDLVTRMEPGFARGASVNSAAVNGHAEWDGHDLGGNVVVRGLYLYRIQDPGNGSVSGKFAVISK